MDDLPYSDEELAAKGLPKLAVGTILLYLKTEEKCLVARVCRNTGTYHSYELVWPGESGRRLSEVGTNECILLDPTVFSKIE